MGKIGISENPFVTLNLVSSSAFPILLYGINSIKLPKESLNELSFAYNTVFSKLFNIRDSAGLRLCQLYSGHLNFQTLYDRLRFNFLKNCINCNLISHLSIIDRGEINEYNSLIVKYNLSSLLSEKALKTKFFTAFKTACENSA